jgi:hypothetical protein
MNKVLAVLAGGLLVGAFAAAYAELPPPSDQEKAAAAAKAEKAAAEKAQDAKELARAQDKAVANWRKNKGSSSSAGTTTQPALQQGSTAAPARPQSEGADHATSRRPDSELTREEAQTEMPKPGQANDHSTTARDPQNSSGRR